MVPLGFLGFRGLLRAMCLYLLEPMTGFEPVTRRLQNARSDQTELHWRELEIGDANQ